LPGAATTRTASSATRKSLDNTAEVQADYAAEPDFYRFRSLEDLPAGPGLGEWRRPAGDRLAGGEKGRDPVHRAAGLSAHAAHRGSGFQRRFPAYILDDVVMLHAHLHPDELELLP
jgi:microcin C transport system substrate-binding protein